MPCTANYGVQCVPNYGRQCIPSFGNRQMTEYIPMPALDLCDGRASCFFSLDEIILGNCSTKAWFMALRCPRSDIPRIREKARMSGGSYQLPPPWILVVPLERRGDRRPWILPRTT